MGVPRWTNNAAATGDSMVTRNARSTRRTASTSADMRLRHLAGAVARLEAARSSEEIRAAVVTCAVDLTGAQRVLLITEAMGKRAVAASRLPPREDTQRLLTAVDPWLDEAQQQRAPRLRHGPDGARPVDQRSCVVAPLLVGDRVVGHLYADIDGARGRFSATDAELLAVLAVQAAAALANREAIDELVKEKTQRNAELAVINGVQHGIAGALDFQAIVDQVGDRLRELFAGVNL